MRRITLLLFTILYLLPTSAQTAPKVVTDARFARGATMAFGRIKSATANGGSSISTRGLCIAENPNPTVDDIVSTKTITNNGTIYYFEDLKPSTKYYMRAYATNKDGVTGYGETIKFYTIPMGDITCSYNNGGDDAANKRINDALTQACSIFSNLMCVKKHFGMGYSSGTPTADCYYADEPWINMGANSSYQRCGTIMHEMQHGLGVIPYSTQWAGSIMRSGDGTGDWIGERTSAFLDFWDNTTGSFLHGDTQHMWPYGVNGAQEDDGSLKTYYANAMIGQALGEDGLEHRYNTFADPCYIFDQEDDIKYYLKNESPERGLYDSYLIPTSTGVLKWRAMSAEEVMSNDSAAWYITFTPANQYYQFRNAATGQYLTYSTNIKTMSRTTLTANDNFHLMKGRVDVGSGKDVKRGYWIIHPTNDWNPTCLQANVNGATGSTTLNRANSATNQRWLILTAEEMQALQSAAVKELLGDLDEMLAIAKNVSETPHTTKEDGADITSIDKDLTDPISTITAARDSYTSPQEVTNAINELQSAVMTFLTNVKVSDMSQPFDLTWLLVNPNMDNGTDGWSSAATNNYSCCEFYEKTFDFNQTTKQKVPAGTYELRVQAFQRPGAATDTYTDFVTNGTDNVKTQIYIKTKSQKVKNIWADAQSKSLGGTSSNQGGKYVPNNMLAASKWFAAGFYENSVMVKTTTAATMKVGIRLTSNESKDWTCFDNFRLFYYGDYSVEEVTPVENIMNPQSKGTKQYYDLSGRRVSNPTKGLYIVNGKKVYVK